MPHDGLIARAAQLYVDWIAVHPTHRQRAFSAKYGSLLEELRQLPLHVTLLAPIPPSVEARTWNGKRCSPGAVFGNRLRCIVMGSRRTNLWEWRFQATPAGVQVTKIGVFPMPDDLLVAEIQHMQHKIVTQQQKPQRTQDDAWRRKELQWLREAKGMLTAIRRYERDGGASAAYQLRKLASRARATSATS